LARGYIVESEVANFAHARRTAFIRTHLGHYHIENPSNIYEILESSQCKLLIPEWEIGRSASRNIGS
jgi:hypothetical protein